ncbi:hypothetical protein NDU88_005867 [Pleurodeles waltl]|uniref:Uncharacterized protein n=1 Tax=Pleurodeles waltl TaxID=8319 RepID=A0AAV7MYS9_PLEWA|nr:hypothetical protein NDU88_005867 [Pleurodeles waltl]
MRPRTRFPSRLQKASLFPPRRTALGAMRLRGAAIFKTPKLPAATLSRGGPPIQGDATPRRKLIHRSAQ